MLFSMKAWIAAGPCTLPSPPIHSPSLAKRCELGEEIAGVKEPSVVGEYHADFLQILQVLYGASRALSSVGLL